MEAVDRKFKRLLLLDAAVWLVPAPATSLLLVAGILPRRLSLDSEPGNAVPPKPSEASRAAEASFPCGVRSRSKVSI